ncbi:MAG: hypothetical protein OEW35_11770 [Gammaproteobacteria bacterium]|nr:hypothetical protein [Gammaproteobacteria bacterium]MDH4253309.1 hypothetical protein [Gammaproteobacteria bacterium]MDH5309918.1 hypothetical protein [Gammaproteobacteria bacterium]
MNRKDGRDQDGGYATAAPRRSFLFNLAAGLAVVLPARQALSQRAPAEGDRTDAPDPDFGRLWPVTETVPFHYPHPVTGRPLA